MQDTLLPENPGSTESKGCASCGSNNVIDGYSTPLCADCRLLLIKYPIPLAIKAFAAGVLLILLFALFSFPKNLSLGIHLEKGKQFEEKKQYASAQQEFAKVVDQVPDNLEANAHLMIAAFYNLDLLKMVNTAQKLSGKRMEDMVLYNRVNDLMGKAESFFPNEAMDEIHMKYSGAGEIPDTVFINYLNEYPDNVYGLFSYAGLLYKRKAWAACDSVLQRLLKVERDHMLALRMLATVQREQGQYEASISNCEQIIELNREASYAYAGEARTYLKQKKYEQGLKMALKSVEVDKSDPYNLATLAMAHHFSNQPAKRDAVLNELKSTNDSTSLEHRQFALDVIQQKESL